MPPDKMEKPMKHHATFCPAEKKNHFSLFDPQSFGRLRLASYFWKNDFKKSLGTTWQMEIKKIIIIKKFSSENNRMHVNNQQMVKCTIKIFNNHNKFSS